MWRHGSGGASFSIVHSQMLGPSQWSRGLRKSGMRWLSSSTLDEPYDAASVEAKWQSRWVALPPAGIDTSKPKYYCLSMFPYPSGNLHIGHLRNYTISDCVARFQSMRGFQVLHPMGWDAFGLPAENAAIERGVSPAVWTRGNIEYMKKQLQSLGLRLDWPAEVATCSPEYYKWTQWIFLKMYEKGLVYQKEAIVNWDPVDNTVLANEQVDANGYSWRSGAKVEKKKLKQWFIRITDYADQLLNDLDQLEGWPDAVKKMQEMWIGKSLGTEIEFEVSGKPENPVLIKVFTTRPETLFGVSYVALGHEGDLFHQLQPLLSQEVKKKVADYIEEVNVSNRDPMVEEKDVRGLSLGLEVQHPLTGEKLPLYLASYVLADYGTGAVMGVPAHDARDYRFALHMDIPIKPVFETSGASVSPPEQLYPIPYAEEDKLIVSNEFSGLTPSEAQERITAALARLGKGGESSQYRLRDWLVSRQRYWGTPVPMLHCEKCGAVPVPEESLPVLLPEVQAGQTLKGSKGASTPLGRVDGWKNTVCPCPEKRKAVRDTDTLDTFVDSSWYYLRYPDAKNNSEAFSSTKVNYWMEGGVDLYVGGIEHAILHLLYARFFTKFLHSLSLVPSNEPFRNLLTQGMVLGRTYRTVGKGRYLKPEEVAALVSDANGSLTTAEGEKVTMSWEKMSKSKYNGVDPEHMRELYGADVTRLATLFKAPPSVELEWEERDIMGQARWIRRVWSLVMDYCRSLSAEDRTREKPVLSPELEKQNQKLLRTVHQSIKAVTQALEHSRSFNVAIAELMKLSNTLADQQQGQQLEAYDQGLRALLLMLAPMAPHVASELFERLESTKLEAAASISGQNAAASKLFDVHQQPWPEVDEKLLVAEEVKVVVQVKGKTKAVLDVPIEVVQGDEDKLKELARAAVASALPDDSAIKKTIVVKGRSTIVSFVI